LGLPRASFIEFGYWDNRRKGLLAGERLLHDLRRMETSYLANNRREYELTKRVSLARIDPFALLRLRTEGSCDIHLPEALFELDHPSHYMRRIKSVRVSIIGNTGPYDTVGATLTLTRSELRTSTSSYPDPEQPVVETGGATQSIATSTGVSDAGLFEANLRDERYLPFEGRGAVSQWSLSLSKALRSFDYEGIADVVLEMQYTAREGGQAFATQVEGPDGAALLSRLDSLGLGSQDYGTGRMWGWSAAARFPDEWAALRQPAPGAPHALSLTLEREHYPHPLSGGSLKIEDVFVIVAGGEIASGTAVSVASPDGSVTMDALAADSNLPGLLVAGRSGDPPPPLDHPATGDWTITLDAVPDPTTLRDLIMIVRYTEGA
ncbi:MAG: toxin, partial [Myxococcales bacterium]|nr:toxin [Myxococcales bacterium]